MGRVKLDGNKGFLGETGVKLGYKYKHPGYIPKPETGHDDGRPVAATTGLAGLPSDQWRPLLLTSCEPGMSREYAPCLAQASNVANVEVRAAPVDTRYTIKTSYT
jgi:hypothetical protein